MLNAEDIKPGWYEARMRTWPVDDQHAFVKVTAGVGTADPVQVWQCADERPWQVSDWQFFRRVQPSFGLSDLLFAAEKTYHIISRCRISGTDQNPEGFRDILFSAIVKAGGKGYAPDRNAAPDVATKIARLRAALVAAELWISTQPNHEVMCKNIRDILENTEGVSSA